MLKPKKPAPTPQPAEMVTVVVQRQRLVPALITEEARIQVPADTPEDVPLRDLQVPEDAWSNAQVQPLPDQARGTVRILGARSLIERLRAL